MKRTINSTGRKKIPLDQITIRMEDAPASGGSRTFTAELRGLDAMKLPDDARVYVEPYAKSSYMRFGWGTAGHPEPPDDTSLTDLDPNAPVLFDIKVVDESDVVGRILAAARQVSPVIPEEGDEYRRSLLPVTLRDLGELVWQLDMEPGARPVLVLNSRISGALVRLKTDPMVQGAILPAAVAQILDRLLDPDTDTSEDLDWVVDWQSWFRAATSLEPEEEQDEDVRRELVLKACRSFALQQRFATRTDRLEDLAVAVHD